MLTKARAVAPLVNLLQTAGRPTTQDHAVAALLMLASNDEGRASVAIARRLVGVLQVVEIGLDKDERLIAAKAKAAKALGALSKQSLVVRQAIIQAKGITPLVKLLGDGSSVEDVDETEAHITLLLADLSCSEESREELIAAGAISPLMATLGSSLPTVQEAAVSVLWQLSLSGYERAESQLTLGIPAS